MPAVPDVARDLNYPAGLPRSPEPWPVWATGAVDASLFCGDPRDAARSLLGALLVTVKDGDITGGRIVEAEAYLGADDAGSHASTRGVTPRNSTMYGPPAHTYVYFTYGNHHMLNLVCEPVGTAGAVLVRAIEPLLGIEVMRERRGGRAVGEIANGPGKLAAALGVDLGDNGVPLNETRVFVYHGPEPAAGEIAVSGRIGLRSGHELEYRYYLSDSPFVSRGRTGPAPARRRTPQG